MLAHKVKRKLEELDKDNEAAKKVRIRMPAVQIKQYCTALGNSSTKGYSHS